MNRACLAQVVALLALGLAAHPSTAQQWAPGGVPLCQNGCPGDIPQVVSDGLGGAFVAWRDIRDYSTNDVDVYLQHVTTFGLIALGWPAEGLPVAVLPKYQGFSGLAADGLGGALVAWEDWRNGHNTYVQRVLVGGSLPPGWALNGNPATDTPGSQYTPQVASDGSGGAYAAWEDQRDYLTTGRHIYGQHLTAAGSVAPGWPASGLPICTVTGAQIDPVLFPDDSGGTVVLWVDARGGTFAQRLRSDGTIAAGWIGDGIPIELGRPLRAAARDEAGGFYVVSSTSGPTLGLDGAYYVQRFTFGGAPAPGWPAGGVLACNAPGDRGGVTIDSDATGGVLLSWYDYRPPYDFTGGEIFATRVRADGSLAPGWTVDGTLVSDASDGMLSYYPFIVREGQGGGYVVWQEQGGNELPSMIQHLTGSGQVAAGWLQHGLRVAPSAVQLGTRIAADGQGGAIVAWHEGCCGRLGVWAQRFGADGPTPTLLALVSAEAKEGRVQLDWFSPDAAALSASLYRRTQDSDWLALGSVGADGSGHLRYEDRAVSGGMRYGYRLGYKEQGFEHFSAEIWVEVPALRLALEGLRPNPAMGELVASFTLPSAEPARLQLIDVTGRVLLAREVGAQGTGNHLIRFGGEAPVPAGMYWLRLTQGGRSLLARGVVIR